VKDWNVIVCVYQDGFRRALRALREFGSVEHSPFYNVLAITGVRLGIEQIHLVIEWIIAVGVVSALKGAGKLDFFERVNGQNL